MTHRSRSTSRVSRLLSLGLSALLLLALTRPAMADPEATRTEELPSEPAPPATPATPVAPSTESAGSLPESDATGAPMPPPPGEVAPARPTVILPGSRPEDAPPPGTPRYTQKRRWGLFAAGVVLFLAGYVTDIGLTYGFGHTPGYTSAIPLVGPFIQMSQHYGLDGPPIDSGDPAYDRKITGQIDSANSTIRALVYTGLAAGAVVQLGGAAMLIAGVSAKKVVREYYADAPPPAQPAVPRVAIQPAAGGLRLTW